MSAYVRSKYSGLIYEEQTLRRSRLSPINKAFFIYYILLVQILPDRILKYSL